MSTQQRILANADIAVIVLAPPPGHPHLRATIKLHAGAEIVLREAAVASLVRACVGIKTHPQRCGCRLFGRELSAEELKGWGPLRAGEESVEQIVELPSGA